MRRSLVGGIVAFAASGCYVGLRAQTPQPVRTQTVPVSDPAYAVLVPAGTPLGLELQDSLNTKFTKKGDPASFKVTPEAGSHRGKPFCGGFFIEGNINPRHNSRGVATSFVGGWRVWTTIERLEIM